MKIQVDEFGFWTRVIVTVHVVFFNLTMGMLFILALIDGGLVDPMPQVTGVIVLRGLMISTALYLGKMILIFANRRRK
jgi:hypothetical protein